MSTPPGPRGSGRGLGPWGEGANTDAKTAADRAQLLLVVLVGVLLVVLVGGLAIAPAAGLYIANLVIAPVRRVVESLTAPATGDLTTTAGI